MLGSVFFLFFFLATRNPTHRTRLQLPRLPRTEDMSTLPPHGPQLQAEPGASTSRTLASSSAPLNFESDIQDGHLLIGMSSQPCDILHVPDWVRSSRVVLLRPLLLRRVVLRFVLAPAAQSSLIEASRACAEQWVQQQRKASRQNWRRSVAERVIPCESLQEEKRSAVETAETKGHRKCEWFVCIECVCLYRRFVSCSSATLL